MRASGVGIDTIVSMRRLVLAAVAALVVGVIVWAMWPATSWPRAFCAPVVRVIGTDTSALTYQLQNKNGVVTNKSGITTPTEHRMLSTLRADVVLGEADAPTSLLRSELLNYAQHLQGAQRSVSGWTTAMGIFDVQVGSQLRACGITPVSS
jgi:hypothetical protein